MLFKSLAACLNSFLSSINCLIALIISTLRHLSFLISHVIVHISRDYIY
nr:MAG TPA: hypothetical protein [Caudoviricetes sp.]